MLARRIRRRTRSQPMSHLQLQEESHGGVRVTLSRSDRRNAISLALWRDLRETFVRLASEKHVRSVVLTGAGEHFSGGADIGEFERERGDAATGAVYSQTVDTCVTALMALPQPSIAAVSGYCLGGGCSLAMACDFRLAAADAVFGIPAARLGIVYSVTDTRNLVSLVGVARGRRMLFTAERVQATRAVEWGLADELTDGDPLEAAATLVARLHESAPLSLAGAKRTLAQLAEGVPDPSELAGLQRAALDSSDYREGVRAFLERRKAVFTGC